MNIITIKQKIEEMLKETKESAQDQYIHDKTYIVLDARVEILEKVLELFIDKNKIIEIGDHVDVYGGIECIVVKIVGNKPYRTINAKTFEEVYSYDDMETLRGNCYLISKYK